MSCEGKSSFCNRKEACERESVPRGWLESNPPVAPRIHEPTHEKRTFAEGERKRQNPHLLFGNGLGASGQPLCSLHPFRPSKLASGHRGARRGHSSAWIPPGFPSSPAAYEEIPVKTILPLQVARPREKSLLRAPVSSLSLANAKAAGPDSI